MKTVGIFGGMGPEATFEFYGKIIKLTHAERDQDHIPCVIFSNTQVPDRTESILKGERHIVKFLHDSVRLLEEAGADFIVIPCNTVHYWISEMRKAVRIPVVDMIEETANHLKKLGHAKVGLLATTGTIKTRIYENVFEKHGIDIARPEGQEKVMEIINKIKAGDISKARRRDIEKEIAKMRRNGIGVFVLGCTELPLLFRKGKPAWLVDPMDVLAERAVEMAGARKR